MNVQAYSKATGLGPHTIRYYDRLGLLEVARSPNGHRVFSQKDVAWAEFIKRLKDTKMPLEQIKRYAQLRAQGPSTIAERKQLLESHAAKLEQDVATMQVHLAKLRQKISGYEEAFLQEA